MSEETAVRDQVLKSPLFDQKGVELAMRRADLIHSEISGNKWWKLKYSLAEASDMGHASILTYGGPHSNHLLAVAAAGNDQGLKTRALVRGTSITSSPTLNRVRELGMEIRFLDRAVYDELKDGTTPNGFQMGSDGPYIIPEGGSNALGVKGIVELMSNTEAFDLVVCPVGSGGTLAGVAASLSEHQRAIGFSAIKDGSSLTTQVNDLCSSYAEIPSGSVVNDQWSINSDFHFGGFAKMDKPLFEFSESFKSEFGIALDYIYTAKMMFGLIELIRNDQFSPNTKILVLHTGGLQGNPAMLNRWKKTFDHA